MPQPKRQRQKAGRQFRQEQIKAAQRRRKRRNQAFAIVVAVALIGIVAFAASRGGDNTNTTVTAGETLPKSACPKLDGSSPRTLDFKKKPPMCINAKKKYTAHVSTTEGDYDIDLDTDKTPKTVNNFVFLSRYHYYDNTTITRIDDSIEILQGGAPHTESIADPGPGYTIDDEGSGFKYSEGDIVMARAQGPNSGAAQYFLVYGNKASALNSQGTYVTFGKVKGEGLAVWKKIGALFEKCPDGDQTCLGGHPSHKVTITSVKIEEA
ncbi:MAG: peptidyl-prolyl cis-trans isomerase [Acidimicrobiaceae bacterium]|nr:peptidyl-prolyl cis-trans isomerase [Acidimicrobiaceae bacterium]